MEDISKEISSVEHQILEPKEVFNKIKETSNSPKLYRSKTGNNRRYNKRRDNSDSHALEISLKNFKTAIVNRFDQSKNRSKIIENLQGLIDFLVKQQKYEGRTQDYKLEDKFSPVEIKELE